jgi:hypothetical protein
VSPSSPARRPPEPTRLLVALLLSLVGSLALDALLVAAGTAAFPATKGYGHFHFSDYGVLTAIGVVLAWAAWVVVAQLAPDPRRDFFRLAVGVTVVLLLPDVWLLIRHEPGAAVAVLMCMHLGIALVTYNVLVHVAPAREVADGDQAAANAGHHEATRRGPPRLGRWVWIVMMIGIGLELACGIVALLLVPLQRTSAWVPAKGVAVYLAHAVLGGILTLAAMWLVTVAPRDRVVRAAIFIGSAGLVLGAAGGILAVYHSSRFPGLGLMFAGSLIAFFGYLIPLIEPDADQPTEAARPGTT